MNLPRLRSLYDDRMRTRPLALCLLAGAAAAFSPLPGADDAAAPAGRDGTNAVVLLKRQFLPNPGDFDAFCRTHEATPRKELRAEVTGKLEALRRESREALAPFLAEDPEITLGRWSCLVNAAVVTAPEPALGRLEAHPEVAAVYRAGTHRFLDAFFSLPPLPDPLPAPAPRDVTAPAKEPPLALDGLQVSWNLREVGAEKAWKEFGLTGRGVVVGLMDEALCQTSPDLADALWVNPGETIVDGKDDDGNGFIDDLFGYDFAANRPDIHAPRITHALRCAGIIAGRGKSGTLTGVAPRARLMGLVVMSQAARGHFPAFEYALGNGADIVSMSFMMPLSPEERAVWRLACEHLTAAGVLLAGGAGNNGPDAGARKAARVPEQIQTPKDIPCVLCVAGVTRKLVTPGYSSRGPVTWEGVKPYDDFPMPKGLQKPDLAAFSEGYAIQTPKGPSDKAASRGNSYAGPHAVGAAALLLEADPDLKPWQVKRILCETARDLAEPGWDPATGWGLLDIHAAAARVLKEKAARAAPPK